MTPPKLGAKEFEEALLAGGKRAPGLTMSRYGVQVSMFGGKWVPVPSLPDFEGVTAGDGRQFIIEAKVCAGASFEVRQDKLKPRQVRHMLERSRYGVRCFLVIHWTQRQLVTRFDPGMTVAIRIDDALPIWQGFLDGQASSITRAVSLEVGRVVLWTCPKGSRKPLPDLERLLESATQPTLL